MLRSDNFDATGSAQKLIPDPRALHYWDGDGGLLTHTSVIGVLNEPIRGANG